MSPLLAGATAARPLGALSGVRPGTPSSTVTATSTLWTVTPFAGVIDGQAAAIAGPYGFSVDANVTGAVTAADATNPRKDIVYVRVSDPAEGDGSGAPIIEVLYLAGTAAGSPVAPATPARSFVIANINVPVSGGGSPTVTWNAPYAVAAGATMLPTTFALLPATGDLGQMAYVRETGILYRWSGSAWKAWESDWISHTPTLTASTGAFAQGTGGAAALLSRYKWMAGDVDWDFNLVFGTSGGQMGTQPRVSMPVTAAALKHLFMEYKGGGDLFDSSTNAEHHAVVLAQGSSTTTVQINYLGTNGQASDVVGVSSPFAIGAGDAYSFRITYTPA